MHACCTQKAMLLLPQLLFLLVGACQCRILDKQGPLHTPHRMPMCAISEKNPPAYSAAPLPLLLLLLLRHTWSSGTV
jgi:hypothetical protein